ncbi:MAG TPA: bifunctional phosphopantothenoylcysteine decarboxylase/phosphopantothenate--cysteine ligase CoaBC [Bacteroidales bacterium]|nr:bifunctional phosphopantothenoylcysteine decarboxylase/phosphopantothenate--cysteine ligase CoaBC [Bacteroidales bacterium]
MLLQGKKILLAVTGSIAAYKAAILVRMLVKEGAEVKVLMTPLAKEFITPLTLATLSKNPILVDFFNPENGDWNSHVDLGLWADAYLVAPATANTIGKMANGIADNLVITTYLSARCKVFVAPAMDLDMFSHPTTTRNLATLKSFGNIIIEPATGELASGLEGKGRMEEPENIVKALADYFGAHAKTKDLLHKKVLVTAGPTYEAIDPVRFIGNYSSGKMGFAIAEELANRGAMVILVSGPVSLKPSHPNIQLIKISSANEMHDVCKSRFPHMDAAILSAAVADFTPVHPESKKVKREKENYMLELKPTTDIAAQLGKTKKNSQVLVGFALETNDELANAQKKLKSKNLDFIILNSLNDPGAGFQVDTNKITIIDKDNNIQKFELKTKAEVAADIVNKLITCF